MCVVHEILMAASPQGIEAGSPDVALAMAREQHGKLDVVLPGMVGQRLSDPIVEDDPEVIVLCASAFASERRHGARLLDS